MGSFANLIADRLNVRSIWGGRSICLNCGEKLTWRELVPVLSYIFLGGKCKHCKSKLTPSFLVSELGAGVLTVLLYNLIFSSQVISLTVKVATFSLMCLIMISMIAIAIYDLRHKFVPFKMIEVLFVVGALLMGLRFYLFGFNLYELLSPLIVSSIFTIIYLISRGAWVGMGDVMLYFVCGMIFSLPIAVTGFFYSIWLGAFVSFVLLILNKKEYNLKTEIPFTPFIMIGMLLAYLTSTDILNLYGLLF